MLRILPRFSLISLQLRAKTRESSASEKSHDSWSIHEWCRFFSSKWLEVCLQVRAEWQLLIQMSMTDSEACTFSLLKEYFRSCSPSCQWTFSRCSRRSTATWWPFLGLFRWWETFCLEEMVPAAAPGQGSKSRCLCRSFREPSLVDSPTDSLRRHCCCYPSELLRWWAWFRCVKHTQTFFI